MNEVIPYDELTTWQLAKMLADYINAADGCYYQYELFALSRRDLIVELEKMSAWLKEQAVDA